LPIAFQGTGIITRRRTIASSAATVESLIKALLHGVAFLRNPKNKPQSGSAPQGAGLGGRYVVRRLGKEGWF